jgi:putative lipoic acid-binding regulatory protein
MKDFESLRGQLEQTDFPQVYFFKFIVPNQNDNVAKVSALFPSETQVQMKPSSSGKFISIGVKQVMLSAGSIINIYLKASEIEGIISL